MIQIRQNVCQAFPKLDLTGQLRSEQSHFKVNELLGFEPSNEGEHHLVLIEKRGENTQWVASQIAKLAGVPTYQVGYCGRKDRHAITKQWFSVQLPGKPKPNWSELASESIHIKQTAQHHKKLRPGMHQGNEFVITLTNLEKKSGQCLDDEDISNIAFRLNQIASIGVPNYFGPQRFGRQGHNLVLAQRWFEQNRPPRKDQKSMILSSARALLFNEVLSFRVKQNNWSTPLGGEPSSDGQATAPLWGRGRPLATAQTLALETEALRPLSSWQDALEHQGLQQERRPTVLHASNLEYEIHPSLKQLTLSFGLPTGCFATTVINEVLNTTDQSQQAKPCDN